MRRAGIRASVAAALAALAGGHYGQEAGATAEAGRWTTTGGCAARTGASESAPLLGAARVAWRFDPPGTIESEPLVWDGKVLLAVHERGTSRQLVLLDLADGSVLATERIRAATPLAPALEEDLVVVRAAPNELHTYRIVPGRLEPAATLVGRGAFSAPLVFGGDLYAREGDRIACWPLLSAEPRWIEEGPERYRGTPSLRGDRVYAVKYDDDGRAFLVTLLRADGHSSADVLFGRAAGAPPPQDAEIDVVVLADEVFVHFPPIPSATGGGPAVCARVERGERGFAIGRPPSTHAYRHAPVALPEGWLVLEHTERAGLAWTGTRPAHGGLLLDLLAMKDFHEELLRYDFPASRARRVGYLGDLAFTLEGSEEGRHVILWRAPVEPAARPIPVDRGVLVRTTDGALVCLRDELEEGPEERLDVEIESERELADAWTTLAERATKAGDPELALRFLSNAEQAGAKEAALSQLRARAARLRDARKPPKRDDALVEVLTREASTLPGLPVQRLWAACSENEDPRRELELLRALLARDPGHEGALDRLRARLPAGLEVSEESAPGWLDVLAADVPLEIVQPPDADASGLTRSQRIVGGETERWRPDLIAVQSPRLLIVAPLAKVEGVTRCLAIGELLCDVLEELLPGTVERGELHPLTLFLYETHEEYIEESQRLGSHPEIASGFTGGHYDPRENLSRMFVPTDTGITPWMLTAYAHELTHHWIQMRCPLFSFEATLVERLDLPGYWVAEGFAEFVEEFQLDPRAGTWSVEPRRAVSLELVANAAPNQLIPWSQLFAMTRPNFGRLQPADERPIEVSWRLGSFALASEKECFYAQAAAVCRFLWESEDGVRRQALRDYVRAWYVGDREALDVARAFGMTPDELGARVVAWARERVD